MATGPPRNSKALMEGGSSVKAVRLEVLPEPDFVGVAAKDLPYDE